MSSVVRPPSPSMTFTRGTDRPKAPRVSERRARTSRDSPAASRASPGSTISVALNGAAYSHPLRAIRTTSSAPTSRRAASAAMAPTPPATARRTVREATTRSGWTPRARRAASSSTRPPKDDDVCPRSMALARRSSKSEQRSSTYRATWLSEGPRRRGQRVRTQKTAAVPAAPAASIAMTRSDGANRRSTPRTSASASRAVEAARATARMVRAAVHRRRTDASNSAISARLDARAERRLITLRL